jgi:hypothetical protein
MRRLVRLLLVVGVAAAGLGLFAPTSAPASCVGPRITVPGPTAAPTTLPDDETAVPVVRLVPGQTVTVTGEYFFVGCDDTGTVTTYGPGCERADPPKPPVPARDVALELTWNGRTFALGTADAGDEAGRWAVSWTFTVPEDIVPGVATGILTTSAASRPVGVEFVEGTD